MAILEASIVLNDAEFTTKINSAIAKLAKLKSSFGSLSADAGISSMANQLNTITNNANSVSNALKNTAASAGSLNTAFNGISAGSGLNAIKGQITSIQNALSNIKPVNLVDQAASHSISDLAGHINRLSDSLNQAGRNANHTEDDIRRVGRAASGINLQGLLNIGGIGLGGAAVISMIDNYTVLNNRLKLVTNSAAEQKQVLASLSATAQSTGTDLGSVGQTYQRLAQNATSLGLSQQELLTITDSISKAMITGGSSANEASNALRQLGQALASNTLRGDELNSVMENTPGLAQAIAAGLGVEVGALRKLASNNEITAKQIANAILKQTPVINQQFGQIDLTISQSIQNFKTAAEIFLGESSKTSGAASIIAGSINLVAKNMDLLATAALAYIAVNFSGALLKGVAAVKAFASSWVLTTSSTAAATAANEVYNASLARTIAAEAVRARQSYANLLLQRKATFAVTAGMAQGGIKNVGDVRQMGAMMSTMGMAENLAIMKMATPMLLKAVGVLGVFTTAVTSGAAAINSMIDAAQGRQTDNWFSQQADKLFSGWIKDSGSIGGRLADLQSKGFNALDTFFSTLSNIIDNETDAERRTRYQQKDPKTRALSVEAINISQDLAKLGKAAQEAASKLNGSKFDQMRDQAKEQYSKFQGKTENTSELDKQAKVLAATLAQINDYEGKTHLKSLQDVDTALKEQIDSYGKNESELKAHQAALDASKVAALAASDADKEKAASYQSSINAQLEQLKSLEDAKKAQDELTAKQKENSRTINDMATRAGDLAAQLATSSDNATNASLAFKLSLNGADAATRKQAIAANNLVRQLERELAVRASLEDLQTQYRQRFMSDNERQLDNLQSQGATPDQLAQAKYWLDGIEAARKQNEAGDKLGRAADGLVGAAKQQQETSKTWFDRKPLKQADTTISGLSGGGNISAGLDTLPTPPTPAPTSNNDAILKAMAALTKTADIETASTGTIDALNKGFSAVVNGLSNVGKTTNAQALPQSANGLPSGQATPTSTPKDMGSIRLDFSGVNGQRIAGVVLGEPSFLKSLQNIIGATLRQYMNTNARAVQN